MLWVGAGAGSFEYKLQSVKSHSNHNHRCLFQHLSTLCLFLWHFHQFSPGINSVFYDFEVIFVKKNEKIIR